MWIFTNIDYQDTKFCPDNNLNVRPCNMMHKPDYIQLSPKRDKFDLGTCRSISNDKVYYNVLARINDKHKMPFYSSFDKWQLTNNK